MYPIFSDLNDHIHCYTTSLFRSPLHSGEADVMLCFDVTEKERSVENYLAEVCAVQARDNGTCKAQMDGFNLHIPVVPCNFVPVQPQHYYGNIHINRPMYISIP